MIYVENLLNLLSKKKLSFFTGVPDSVLKPLSTYLENKKNHIIAPNEGAAISLGIGYYLSTKKLACVYMQNSGLGNAINPLASISHPKVYSIPIVLIIGWRGRPNTIDEPQHMTKGLITKDLLRLLGIDFCTLSNEEDLNKLKLLIDKAKRLKKPVACLVKNKFLKNKKKIKIKIKENIYPYRHEIIYEILKLINPNSRLIATTGFTSRELYQIRKNSNNVKGKDFYVVGGMGHCNSVALGYSLKSKKEVICLDGDGSILMHLGSLLTIGTFAKKNFKHILFNNNSHESVGSQKTNADKVNFKLLSKSLGYNRYYKINKKKKIRTILKKFLKSKGPSLLEIKIKNGSIENLKRPKNLKNIKNLFIKH